MKWGGGGGGGGALCIVIETVTSLTLCVHSAAYHYDDVIMGAVASEITSLTIVYSTVYSDADQR